MLCLTPPIGLCETLSAMTFLAPLRAAVLRVPAPILGMILMALTGMLNTTMSALVKDMVHEMSVFEIAFFRHFIGVLLLAPFLMRGGLVAFRTTRLGLHALRAVLNIGSMFAFFGALALIPLTQVTALSFTAPLFTSVLAVLILGEVMKLPRIVGLVLGFVGAMIIIRPGMVEVNLGSIYILCAMVTWAGALTVIKMVSRTDSAVTIAFYAAFLQLPLALAAAVFFWQWPTWQQLLQLLAIASFGSLAQICLSQAFRMADATVVLPMDFTKLLWASVLGYLMFGDVPDPWSWIGGAVVFAGVMYVAYSERRRDTT